MEYIAIEQYQQGESTYNDTIRVNDGVLKHYQVERRNGNTFMRLKTRKLAVSR